MVSCVSNSDGKQGTMTVALKTLVTADVDARPGPRSSAAPGTPAVAARTRCDLNDREPGF